MGEPNWLRETRAAYDEVAVDYARLVHGELARRPLERALLAAFAELVGGGGTTRAAASGPVVEVGCGTGRITAYLCGLGLGVAGLDLSPGMVAVARESWPGLRFGVASMTDLPLPDAGLAGLVAWYSIIHLPPEALPTVFAEFHRVLAPGGELLLAFKAGDRRIRLEQAYGHTVSYDVHWLPPDRIAAQLAAAGFAVHARLVREPEDYERGPQAYLLARRPHDADPA
ncbi:MULTISPECIES: class I SAM-dependent DNA methyltransferase [Micromonospora]|uniref:class I SAM-dependent DNA methyltransferase n=1 Tax=Micromonospora TaxID=1873 RepID=UPI00098D6327|nr:MULTISPECIES: class I SAM-dependent methyltransferase [unclassified Micromonospora]MDI5941247.1 class I SAM-dependent methyltransferase [Micromonospora sp. DH15]OON31457.1 SAM-dependent methyltransferase [Micromonospora sp. Rc5]